MQSVSRNRRTLHEILIDLGLANVDLGVAYSGFVCQVRSGYSPGIMLKNHPFLNPHAIQELQKRFQERTRSGLYIDSTGGEYTPPLNKFAPNTIEGMVTELARPGRFEDIGLAVREGSKVYQHQMVERGMRNYFIAGEYRAIARSLQEKL